MMGRRRASSAEIGGSRKWRREVQAKLRERQKSEGLEPVVNATLPNRLSQYESEEQEREAREEAVIEKVAVMRGKLPGLLRKLADIPDPRQPKKIKHKLTCLLLYGILGFVLQVASRRAANRELSRPVFRENLLLLFPDLEKIPHHDTLKRLLNRIELRRLNDR